MENQLNDTTQMQMRTPVYINSQKNDGPKHLVILWGNMTQ